MANVGAHKRKHVVLMISDKPKVCQLVKSRRTFQSIVDKYDVGKSTVDNIMKIEKKLHDFQNELEDSDCIKKRKTVKKADLLALDKVLDKVVYLWFMQQRCKQPPISGPLVMNKACQLYLLVYPDGENPSSFKSKYTFHIVNKTHTTLAYVYRKSLNKSQGVYFLSEVFKKASI